MDQATPRPSFPELMMETAWLWSTRGTCSRLQVGAVLERDNRIVSIGYNGTPSGMEHCLHIDDEPCVFANHAEENVLFFAAKYGIATDGTTLYVTAAPCYRCSRGIINAGVRRVVFGSEYRDSSGLDLLRSASISAVKLGP